MSPPPRSRTGRLVALDIDQVFASYPFGTDEPPSPMPLELSFDTRVQVVQLDL